MQFQVSDLAMPEGKDKEVGPGNMSSVLGIWVCHLQAGESERLVIKFSPNPSPETREPRAPVSKGRRG